MQASADRYNYICTHVKNLKIIAKSPEHWLEIIQKIFLIKSAGPPEYYLGTDFRYEDKEKIWTSGCTTYSKETICWIKEAGGTLRKEFSPLPVEREEPVISETDHIFY